MDALRMSSKGHDFFVKNRQSLAFKHGNLASFFQRFFLCVSGVATGEQRLFTIKHKESILFHKQYIIKNDQYKTFSYFTNKFFLVASDFRRYLPVSQSLVLKGKFIIYPQAAIICQRSLAASPLINPSLILTELNLQSLGQDTHSDFYVSDWRLATSNHRLAIFNLIVRVKIHTATLPWQLVTSKWRTATSDKSRSVSPQKTDDFHQKSLVTGF